MAELTPFQKSLLGQTFFFKWILANALGGMLGWFVGLISAIGVVVLITMVGLVLNLESQVVITLAIGVGIIVAAIIFGVLLGAIQWFVLRKYNFQTIWWFFASAMGIIVGSGVGWALGGYAAIATIGLVAGAIQWLGLRRQVSPAGWWILVSPIGLVMGNYVGEIIFGNVLGQAIGAAESLNSGPLGATDAVRVITGVAIVVALSIALVGAVYGMITGRLLIWLSKYPNTDAQIATANIHSLFDSDEDILL
jgi:hypothetical protein